MENRYCINCGKPLPYYTNNEILKKFCSIECHNAFYKNRPKKKTNPLVWIYKHTLGPIFYILGGICEGLFGGISFAVNETVNYMTPDKIENELVFRRCRVMKWDPVTCTWSQGYETICINNPHHDPNTIICENTLFKWDPKTEKAPVITTQGSNIIISDLSKKRDIRVLGDKAGDSYTIHINPDEGIVYKTYGA